MAAEAPAELLAVVLAPAAGRPPPAGVCLKAACMGTDRTPSLTVAASPVHLTAPIDKWQPVL